MLRHRFPPPLLLLLLVPLLQACDHRATVVEPASSEPEPPPPPRDLQAWYHARAVHVAWELDPRWDGESFRVYGKRASDAGFFLIAEVTNCSEAACSYTDVNIRPATTYIYDVAAVSPGGAESASDRTVEVFVPEPVPPPAPDGTEAVALDGAVYLRWSDGSRAAGDFSHYRVYLDDPEDAPFLLGETDSEGFLDERAVNGSTLSYFVTALDDQGHESQGSVLAEATPRPDFHGEWLWAHEDRPDASGFRFQVDEGTDPVVAGDDPTRHLRLEADGSGWWLVPGPSAWVHQDAFATTALRCGPGSDAGCVELTTAPASGYVTDALELLPLTTYVLRVQASDGTVHYGALYVRLLGTDQNGDGIAIFDWAYQLQPDNRALNRRSGAVGGR